MTFPLLSTGGLRRMESAGNVGNETTGGCLDFVQGITVREGVDYFVDACTRCRCVTTGGPTMCHQISCSDPVDCPPGRLRKVATICCQVCDDRVPLDGQPSPHVGVSMQLGSVTVTFVLILILVLFVMHRARKKRFFMALTRFPMMRRNSSGNGAGGCSSDEMTVDQQINFDSDLPLHSVVIGGEIVVNPDPPPPYSLPTENLASNQQRVIGEPPPPYAAAITNVNLIQHRTNQGTDGLANGNFSDSDTSSSSGLDDDYFTPSMSESDTEPVQCDCPNCCLSSAQRATQAATCWNSPSSLQCGNEPNCRGEETPHPSGIVSTQLRYNGESSSVPVTEILPSLCPDCHHRVNQQLSNDSAVARFHASRDKRLGEDSGGIDHSKILQHKKMSRAVRRKVKKVLRKNPRPTHTSSTTAAVDRVSVTSNLAEHNTVAVSNASES